MKKKKLTANRLLDIMEWIENHCCGFYSYTVDDYGVVNIKGDLILTPPRPIKIEVEFGKVSGSFVASYAGLKSLKNCPKKVKKNYFVSGNRLKNLDYAPEFVGENFYCSDNLIPIESFKGLKHVGKLIKISFRGYEFLGNIDTYKEYAEQRNER